MEKIWIDAAEFESYGGFTLETQFVREMGQAYLLANGVGEAVKPASVTFKVTEGGHYRIHIRTKNWHPDTVTDGIFTEIDGIRTDKISGGAHIRDWYFDVAGDYLLGPGSHTLKIYDTNGWFARFACVIITNDFDFTPSRELSLMKKQREQIKGNIKKNTVMRKYDLVVIGAGIAGIVAAITAARHGIKTALINDRPVLGGNASEEANVVLEGAAHRGYHETGVVFELKSYRHAKSTSWTETFNKFTSQEENLDVFQNMLLINANTENDLITDITAIHTLDMREYKFSAPLFVDASGDGWLGYYAGALYRIGREAKFQHGESFAPAIADGNTMSGCTTSSVTFNGHTVCGFLAEKTDAPVEFHAPEWAYKLPDGDSLGRTPSKIECGDWWLELQNDYDDLFESEFVRDSMIRMSVGYFDWLKNSWTDRKRAENYRLKTLGTFNAKRESRRLIGDYILTENDYVAGKTHPDTVCYCGWNLDVHHKDGIFSGKSGAFTSNKAIPISEIPFGAMYSKNIGNLMMAGRCISATHIGLGAIRVQLTTGTMGQAVGTAAYLCKKYNAKPRVIRNSHIDELQQLLLRDGMTIPGVKHHDESDLALEASVSATSFVANGAPENVINGKVWANDGCDYAWISESSLPQSIELKFRTPKTVSKVCITFDIPFEQYKYGYMAQPEAKGLISDFSISVLSDGEWYTVSTITDNIMRLVKADFEPTVAEAVKITVLKTAGSENAIIPEIRIY